LPSRHVREKKLQDIFSIGRARYLILDFTEGLTFEEFEKDLKTISAVLHQLMIMGEAVKRLEVKFKSNYPHIPWKEMAGMRDVLIHQYEDSDLAIIWAVVKKNLPTLVKDIKKLKDQLA
jgi:uncharacterized protein with HEPN domain